MSKEQTFIDSMVLGSGHSILTSHIPGNNSQITPQIFTDKFYEATKFNKESVDSFGLFGSSINYNTFYPDASVEVFNPKEEEFIEPMFRMLSACIVAKNYNPTEFPESVLKASMNLLVGQTVNCDHETDIANAIGSVKSVTWQNSFVQDGVTIPAGINAVLKIDGIANPRIVRGIYMDPPSIHSNSVTVQFEWKPSHQFEKVWEFYEKLGTIAEDGTMVRRIVTNIIAYRETSLVSHGADPFAQLIRDGKINNPKYADQVYYQFQDETLTHHELKNKFSFFDFKGSHEIDIMYNTSKSFIEKDPQKGKNQSPKNSNNSMNELEKFLEQLFGENMLSLAEGSTPSTEVAINCIQQMLKDNQTLSEGRAEMEKEIATLKDEKVALESKIKANETMVNIGKEHLSDVRSKAIASYKKTVGEDKVDQNIIALLEAETTNLETLISLGATYDAQLEERFPLHCADCGSHNVNRSSSMANKEEKEGNKSEYASVRDYVKSIADKKR